MKKTLVRRSKVGRERLGVSRSDRKWGHPPQTSNIDSLIWKSSIGHYGGEYVYVPVENWRDFKNSFPGRVFPRNAYKENISHNHTEYAQREFNDRYPHSRGEFYQVFFADKSKGLKHYDRMRRYSR